MTEPPTEPAPSGSVLDSLDPEVGVIDLASVAFARRLANLLFVSRQQSGLSRRALAKRSQGRFTSRDLKAAEEAKRVFGPTVVGQLSALYGVDLSVLLPDRLPLAITDHGVISTSGVEVRFDPNTTDSLLMAYLRLVRTLRRQQRARVIDLRRGDVEVLAAHLGREPSEVLDQLGSLMGSSRVQRGSMAVLLATGAEVVGLAPGSSVDAQRSFVPPASSGG